MTGICRLWDVQVVECFLGESFYSTFLRLSGRLRHAGARSEFHLRATARAGLESFRGLRYSPARWVIFAIPFW